MIKNVVVYNRISTKGQDFKAQLYTIEKYCKKKKYNIVKYFKEQLSGVTKLEDRAAILELKEYCRDNSVDAIVVYDFSRLSRDFLNGIELVRYCEKQKINILFAQSGNQVLDDNNKLQESDELNVIFQSFYAEKERLRIASKLKDSKENLVLNHGYAGYGVYTPYGYKSVKKLLKINEEEARIVRLIFHLYAIGFGQTLITEFLNNQIIKLSDKRDLVINLDRIKQYIEEAGLRYVATKNQLVLKSKVPTRTEILKEKGKLKKINKAEYLWHEKVIGDILKNEIYIGKRKYSKKDVKNCPRLLEDELFLEVAEVRKERKKKYTKIRDFEYAISKRVIKCGVCGKNYYPIKRSSGRDNRYVCMSKRTGDECENVGISITTLTSAIWFVLKDNKAIKEHIRSTSKLGETKLEIEELKNRLAELKTLQEKTLNQIKALAKQQAKYNPTVFATMMEAYNDDYNKAESEVSLIEPQLLGLKKLVRTDFSLQKILDNYHTDTDSLKGMVNFFIKEIVINPMKTNPIISSHFKSVFVELYFSNSGTPFCFIISQSSRKIIVLDSNLHMPYRENIVAEKLPKYFDKVSSDFTRPIEKIKPRVDFENVKHLDFCEIFNRLHYKNDKFTIIDAVRKEPKSMIEARANARKNLDSFMVIEEIQDLIE